MRWPPGCSWASSVSAVWPGLRSSADTGSVRRLASTSASISVVTDWPAPTVQPSTTISRGPRIGSSTRARSRRSMSAARPVAARHHPDVLPPAGCRRGAARARRGPARPRPAGRCCCPGRPRPAARARSVRLVPRLASPEPPRRLGRAERRVRRGRLGRRGWSLRGHRWCLRARLGRDRRTAPAGACGLASAGTGGTAPADACGLASAGTGGTAPAGACGLASAGTGGTAAPGACGLASAGACGRGAAGASGNASAGACAAAGTRGAVGATPCTASRPKAAGAGGAAAPRTRSASG